MLVLMFPNDHLQTNMNYLIAKLIPIPLLESPSIFYISKCDVTYFFIIENQNIINYKYSFDMQTN
jgi:hypothetical protein